MKIIIKDISLQESDRVIAYVTAVTRPLKPYHKIVDLGSWYNLEIDCGEDEHLLDRIVRYIEDQRDWRPSYTIEEV